MKASDPDHALAMKKGREVVQSPPGKCDTPLLQISDLVAGYGKTKSDGMPSISILSDINLSIDRGCVVALIG
jgi:peptide/nickel transport system ATP-binding protein